MPTALHADVIEAINSPHGDFTFIHMLVITLNPTTTMYFNSSETDFNYEHSSSISSPTTWKAAPFSFGDWDEDDKGNLPATALNVRDPGQSLGYLLDANPQFMDSNIETFLYVNGQAGPSTFWSIEGASRDRQGNLSFRLGSQDPFYTTMFPRQRVSRHRCRHVYKGTACGYSGGLATCDQSLRGANGCFAHANQSRFGGCPASR